MENLSTMEFFISELSKELGVRFEKENMHFVRSVLIGKKRKTERFTSTLYYTYSIGYELSFIPNSYDSVELWKIKVNQRGKGLGSELLNNVLDVSDKSGIKIKLVPVDYIKDENTPKNYLQKLKNWYCEMGFKTTEFPSIYPFYTYYPSEGYKMVA